VGIDFWQRESTVSTEAVRCRLQERISQHQKGKAAAQLARRVCYNSSVKAAPRLVLPLVALDDVVGLSGEIPSP